MLFTQTETSPPWHMEIKCNSCPLRSTHLPHSPDEGFDAHQHAHIRLATKVAVNTCSSQAPLHKMSANNTAQGSFSFLEKALSHPTQAGMGAAAGGSC